MDPLVLSRLQFVWVVALHILLPAFTVGLASYIAVLEALYLGTRRPVFLNTSIFWTRIFALSFGMGVVSGIVMPFQFGTNWSRYADATANVLGPLFAYEGLTAFFLEATFLGVLLFGRKLVPPWAHTLAAVMVAAGTLFSSFWILAANSWMHTPAGYRIQDGRFFAQDWMAVIFNPSFPYRLAHTVTGFYITTAFVVIGVAAYHLRAGRAMMEARTMQKMGFGLLTLLVPLQIVLGDMHGLNTLEHQPAKIAAMEANWETRGHMPLVLFAWPDEAAEANRLEIALPELGSLVLRHQRDGVVHGLKDWPREDRPPVAVPFFAFRVMVGLGLAMLALVAMSWWLRWRRVLDRARRFQWLCQWCAPIGFAAVIAGWVITEVGRQPWVVYGLLRTREAVTPSLSGGDVATSLAVYMAAYLFMFGMGLVFMLRLMRKSPDAVGGGESNSERVRPARPARPLSAAREAR
jgi:cytochrome d ubiquinol oxidase subunit I